MSFLKPLFGSAGGTLLSNPEMGMGLAGGLGKLLGADPNRISSIADNIGRGMNQIAQAGGAQEGYAAPQSQQMPVNNHLQLLDPNVLRALIQRFGGVAR